MKKLFFGIMILTLAFSCAKQETQDQTEYIDNAFVMWMEKNHPEATRLESGAYIEWLVESGSQKKLSNDYWMKLNYTYRRLNGNIYASRSQEVAKQLGIDLPTVHYTSDYLPFYPAEVPQESYPATYNLAQGQADALKLMHEGDSVRIYLPAKLAYTYGGFTSIKGFSPSTSSQSSYLVGSGENVVIDMRLLEIVPEPPMHERAQFEQYVQAKMGVTNLADTIAFGTFKMMLEPCPSGDSITADSTVTVYYIGRLMDGYIFDTNIDSVATRCNIYNSEKSYTAESIKPSSSSGFVQGFWRSVQTMRRGEWARFAFLSSMGYGAANDKGNIQPYTPMIFDIYVEPRK